MIATPFTEMFKLRYAIALAPMGTHGGRGIGEQAEAQLRAARSLDL